MEAVGACWSEMHAKSSVSQDNASGTFDKMNFRIRRSSTNPIHRDRRAGEPRVFLKPELIYQIFALSSGGRHIGALGPIPKAS
jgi:hypothetical protein